MKPYNLKIKVLVDKADHVIDSRSMFEREVEKLGGLEKALPTIAQAFVEMSQIFNKELHVNEDRRIVEGYLKDAPFLKLKLYATWCDNYKNFLKSSEESKLTLYGGKKENKLYIIKIKNGQFFLE